MTKRKKEENKETKKQRVSEGCILEIKDIRIKERKKEGMKEIIKKK